MCFEFHQVSERWGGSHLKSLDTRKKGIKEISTFPDPNSQAFQSYVRRLSPKILEKYFYKAYYKAFFYSRS